MNNSHKIIKEDCVPEEASSSLEEKVLIIDSHPIYIQKIEGFLYGLTFKNILLAKLGEEGIQMAQSESPDLIISSSLLADMSALEVCSRIREQGNTSKIIVLTGLFTNNKDIQRIKNNGADAVLMRKEKDFLGLQDTITRLMIGRQN